MFHQPQSILAFTIFNIAQNYFEVTTMRIDAHTRIAPDKTVRELSRRLLKRNAEAYDALASDSLNRRRANRDNGNRGQQFV